MDRYPRLEHTAPRWILPSLIGALLLVLASSAHAQPSSSPSSASARPRAEASRSHVEIGPPPPTLLLLTLTTAPSAPLVAIVADEIARSDRYATRPVAAIRPFLRQRDKDAHVIAHTTLLVEEARKAILALDHDQAERKLEAAQTILSSSFVELYDPSRLAKIHLLRAVTALHRARPDLAKEAFIAALHLDPTLTLDAHYSPQVRAAFAKARKNLPPRPLPPADLIARALATLPHGKLAIVLAGDVAAGGLVVLRALTFTPRQKSYTGVEALTLKTGDVRQVRRVRHFGSKLRNHLEAHFPRRPVATTSPSPHPATQSTPRPPLPPPPKPWYKRWYVWVVAGAVIGTAVAIPLATHRNVVEGHVRW